MHYREAKNPASRFAAVLSAAGAAGDPSLILESLAAIERRLAYLETAMASFTSDTAHDILHPSQEKFAIDEAVIDSRLHIDANDKACAFEPNGRPCDHCSMCSARGF